MGRPSGVPGPTPRSRPSARFAACSNCSCLVRRVDQQIGFLDCRTDPNSQPCDQSARQVQSAQQAASLLPGRSVCAAVVASSTVFAIASSCGPSHGNFCSHRRPAATPGRATKCRFRRRSRVSCAPAPEAAATPNRSACNSWCGVPSGAVQAPAPCESWCFSPFQRELHVGFAQQRIELRGLQLMVRIFVGPNIVHVELLRLPGLQAFANLLRKTCGIGGGAKRFAGQDPGCLMITMAVARGCLESECRSRRDGRCE